MRSGAIGLTMLLIMAGLTGCTGLTGSGGGGSLNIIVEDFMFSNLVENSFVNATLLAYPFNIEAMISAGQHNIFCFIERIT